MARYKEYDYSQGKFIPIHFDKQILAGTFEYSLHYLIDNEIDLSLFDLRYKETKRLGSGNGNTVFSLSPLDQIFPTSFNVKDSGPSGLAIIHWLLIM